MKILSIAGRNLASLEGDFLIDFTEGPLKNAGIFAITGATGAGKSTILDALCVALYGRTPRQKNARENTIKLRDGKDASLSQGDARLIMRRGCAEAYASVSFIATDSYPYTSKWSVRRAKNSPGGQMQEYSLELINDHTCRPFAGKRSEVLREIERLTGMTFDQFTRSVLLAQGEFTAFLKAEQHEKAELLEKLTGTEIYSNISTIIYQRARESDQRVKEIASKLEGINLLSADDRKLYSERIGELKKEVDALDIEKQKARHGIELHNQLVDYVDSLNKACAEVEESGMLLKDLSERKEKLLLTERVQEARPLFNAVVALDAKLLSKTEIAGREKTGIQELINLRDDLLLKEHKAFDEINERIKVLSDSEPLIKDARKLDVEIVNKRQELRKLEEERDIIIERLCLLENDSLKKEAEVKKISEQINGLNEWFKQNEGRRQIAENEQSIVLRLNGASREFEQFNSLSKELDETNLNINRHKALLDKKNELLSEKEKLAEPLDAALSQLQKELELYDTQLIENEYTECINKKDQLVAVKSALEKVNGIETDLSALQLKYNAGILTIEDLKSKLLKIEPLIDKAKGYKDASDEILNEARLRTTDNVDSLRKNLKPGKPCVVCGSTEHPYVSIGETLHSELKHLEDKAFKAEQNLTELISERTTLLSNLAHSEKECTNLSADIEARQQTLLNLNNSLYDEIYKAFSTKVNQLTLTDLELLLKENIEQTDSVKRKRDKVFNLIKRINELTVDAEDYKQQILILRQDISDIGNKLRLYDTELTNATRNWDKVKDNLENIRQEVDVYFTRSDWYANWQLSPEAFIKGVRDFAAEWKSKIKELDECISTKWGEEKVVLTLKSNIEERITEKQAKDKVVGELNNLLDDMVLKRRKLFEGREIDLVEKELTEKINEARTLHERLKDERSMKDIDLKEKQGALSQILEEIRNINTELEQHKIKKLEWLSINALEETTALELLEHSTDWINSERKSIKDIEDTHLKAKTRYKERAEQFEKHHKLIESLPPADELNAQIKLIESKLEIISATIAEHNASLRLDKLNRDNFDQYLTQKDELEKINNKWQRLNDMLGSADGKKFRLIAQRYTLDALLAYANKHLNELAPRYMLECVPDTLALQVRDRDMGDEIRSVHYLSGGESFLVSLALALGLASLSSNRMNVESLFIDEGFGSLDLQTLTTAMDALEKLHNSGRKIGVISHVQEMTERIQAQIRVVKLSSGRSQVQIVG